MEDDDDDDDLSYFIIIHCAQILRGVEERAVNN